LSDAGTTVLLTTQYLDEADQLAGRVAIIDGGEVIALGTPDELKRNHSGDTVEVLFADRGDAARAAKGSLPNLMIGTFFLFVYDGLLGASAASQQVPGGSYGLGTPSGSRTSVRSWTWPRRLLGRAVAARPAGVRRSSSRWRHRSSRASSRWRPALSRRRGRSMPTPKCSAVCWTASPAGCRPTSAAGAITRSSDCCRTPTWW
jgi:hypothetical protein